MKKTTVKKLTIELGGQDVELTMEQARELKSALDELFGERVHEVRIAEPYPVYPRHPYRWPWYQPSWICSSGSKVTLSDSSVRLQLKAQ